MVEAVRPAITNNFEIRNYYYGIKKRKGSNPARVATARRLLCIVYRVLKEQTPFWANKTNSGAAFKAA
jgi:transposase